MDLYSLARDHYGRSINTRSLQRAYRSALGEQIDNLTFLERVIALQMRALRASRLLDSWRARYLSDVFGGNMPQLSPPDQGSESSMRMFDEHLLHLMTNRAHDMPDVVVDAEAPPRVNLLVPAFSIAGISAGFFGVFQVGRFLKSQGARVRVVLYDNFWWVEDEFRQALQSFPGMENLLDELEFEYIGERKAPLVISPEDTAVATVWYSAYLAEKIQLTSGRPQQPFLYLIQDYESRFYAANALSALADQTYGMNFVSLVSSETLFAYMKQSGLPAFARGMDSIFFNNACSSNLDEWPEFRRRNSPAKKKNFVIYSRPDVNRNMFELTALTVIKAYQKGYLDPEEWNFYGMGMGGAEIVIDETRGIVLRQLPRMMLSEYVERVKSFDLCLTLMASPHPSMIPFDLGGSGAVVVTNEFATKDQSYFNSYSRNIICKPPRLADLVEGIGEAVKRCEDLEQRHQEAKFAYPKTWEDTWGDGHREFVKRNFGHLLQAFADE